MKRQPAATPAVEGLPAGLEALSSLTVTVLPPASNSPVQGDLGALSSLAVRVLSERTNQAGRCAACGSAWPSSLTEHNLAAAL
jgi:hypothetical protein